MSSGRSASAVALDFVAAEYRLHSMAADWALGQFKQSDLTDAANQVEGLRTLLAELRQAVLE